MKITDSDIIKSSENELIDAITADIDWGAIEQIFRDEHNLSIEEDVEYKKGDIVVYNDQVAYKLEFQVNVMLSVLLDREGNYLSVKTSSDVDDTSEEEKQPEEAANAESEDETERASEGIEPSLPEGMVTSEEGMEASSDQEKNDAPKTEGKSIASDTNEKIAQMAAEAGGMIAQLNED